MVRLNHGRGAYGLEMGWDERAWLLGPLPVSVYTGGFPTERGGGFFELIIKVLKDEVCGCRYYVI